MLLGEPFPEPGWRSPRAQNSKKTAIQPSSGPRLPRPSGISRCSPSRKSEAASSAASISATRAPGRRERGRKPPDDPRKLAAALYAMQLGLQLERLTQPEVVDEELALRMAPL